MPNAHSIAAAAAYGMEKAGAAVNQAKCENEKKLEKIIHEQPEKAV